MRIRNIRRSASEIPLGGLSEREHSGCHGDGRRVTLAAVMIPGGLFSVLISCPARNKSSSG